MLVRRLQRASVFPLPTWTLQWTPQLGQEGAGWQVAGSTSQRQGVHISYLESLLRKMHLFSLFVCLLSHLSRQYGLVDIKFTF